MTGANTAPTVAVLGGGVAGLSAAHELAERGYSVTVYEAHSVPGGKARSVHVPGSATGGRRPLPGEHGFRFFPGFYRHLPDAMRRIPAGEPVGAGRSGSVPGAASSPAAGQGAGAAPVATVADHLRAATEAVIAQSGGKRPLPLPVRFPSSLTDLNKIVDTFVHPSWNIPAGDVLHFVERLEMLLSSCDERRYGEWEHLSWWEFCGAEQRSADYRKFVADGLTRSLVAARAREMSARTGGCILLQLLFDLAVPGRDADRLLDGPTNDVWIDPWLAYLRSLGVDYRAGARVEAISCSKGRIESVTVSDASGRRAVSADHYVAAVPVDVMRTLVTDEMRSADVQLAHLDDLVVRWMNGVQIYLRTDVPIVHGHCIYIDSPWSLSSISQRQFWSGVDFASLGDGDVGGILSVDISDWDTPGSNGKTAMESTHAEVVEEVLLQLEAALDLDGKPLVARDNVLRTFVDPDVVFPTLRQDAGARTDINLEPLLVNTAGSWNHRPEAVTGIENLVLAADYVRTYTDLATMEAANEAARRAVNGILDRTGSSAERCAIWPLHEPELYAPLRDADRLRWKLGRRHERLDPQAVPPSAP